MFSLVSRIFFCSTVLLQLFLFAPYRSNAQYNANQNMVWVFGDSLKLDFNSGAPVLSSTPIYSFEGSGAVCDPSGDLWFYTNGRIVYNRLGDTMPSGRAVVPYYTYSGSQCAAIVPLLDNPEMFYLFSLEHYMGIGRLYYSVIDMSLDGGYGDVVTSRMGIPIDSGFTEQMAVVPGNRCNMWLLVHDRTDARFFAYEITAAGVNTTPVISTVGVYTDCYAAGVLKVSHDRKRLACMNFSHSSTAPSRAELYDFDINTGMVSNCRILNEYGGIYGAAFSPDDTKLYVSSTHGGLYQYDISLPDLLTIIGSEYLVTTYPMGVGGGISGGDMRLAPDDKIYFNGNFSHLDCIKHPNLPGVSCDYVHDYIDFSPARGYLGLPNVVWNTMPPEITGLSDVCVGSKVGLSSGESGGLWSSSNTSVADVISPDTGVVRGIAVGTAIITHISSCGDSYLTITVNPQPAVFNIDTTVCAGNSISLSNATSGGVWSSSDTTIAAVESATGLVSAIAPGTSVITYSLSTGCYRSDTIEVVSCTEVRTVSVDNRRRIQVYPNPASGKFVISISGPQVNAHIRIIDVLGREVLSKEINTSGQPIEQSIDGINAGNYIVRIDLPGLTYRTSLVVANRVE